MSVVVADQAEALQEEKKKRSIKCVVWDLDNTVWQGTLLEGGVSGLRPGVVGALRALDQRGILQSVASKNDHSAAMAQLEAYGIAEYFLYPQIHWGAKSESVARIAKDLNIGIDTFAFIDDQPFERDEVAFAQPTVLCIDAEEIDEMLLRIAPAREEDLKRAEELTLRTNQLNTTGYTYSYDELDFFRTSPDHLLLIAGLDDKHGPYGKIGLVLIESREGVWMVKLLLMSCRVMARGVGTVLINHIRNEARRHGVRLLAEMLPNERNRMMYMTYKFNHFRELEKRDDGLVIFDNDLSTVHAFPTYMNIEIGE